MALHTELAIYKAAYDLNRLTIALMRHVPKDARPVFGRKLAEEGLDIATLIFRANCARDKVPHLDQLIERVQAAELLFRLFRDCQLISTKHYAQAALLTTSVSKQATGWRKHSASSPAA